MVDYVVRDTVAFLEVNNPPVNALSYSVRTGLHDGIEKANKDSNIRAIVIIGKGRTFPSGADIKEFGKPMKGPWLTQVGEKIEASEKPVVAAIHGNALGGGLEIALFSHYRIAVKNSKVGFPEVLIGIIPGAAGTQRLPRVTSVPVAMDLIASGRHISASQAMHHGILDRVIGGYSTGRTLRICVAQSREIVDGDLQTAAMRYAKEVVGKPLDNRRLRNLPVKKVADINAVYESALAEVKRKQKGFIAPVKCLQAVRAAVLSENYDAGLLRELELMRELMTSAQAKALQYSFFAERAAARWQLPTGENYSTCKPLPVKTIGVIGAGTMGSGIVVAILRAGIPVVLVEQEKKFLERGVAMVKSVLEGSVRLKKLSQEGMSRCLSLLTPTIVFEDLRTVDLVIEAVFENLELKRKIFERLDKLCPPSTILCTNTSSLDINKIASATNRPDKVAGMHFFVPAYLMRLLENVYGSKTSGSTVATIMELGKRLGKVSVLVGSCNSFLANRTNQALHAQALFLLEEGSFPEEIDQIFTDFGMPMGIFSVSDLSGLDIGANIRREVADAKGVKLTDRTYFMDGTRYSSLSDRVVKAGRFGRKAGKGWYRYEKPGGRIATPDPEVREIVLSHSKALGIERRSIPPQEILERMLFACINECFRCLEDGIAAKPEDIDTSWLLGFGYPRYRGGPMFYARQVGLQNVYNKICHYQEKYPDQISWLPSDLLRRLAGAKVTPPMSQWTMQASAKL